MDSFLSFQILSFLARPVFSPHTSWIPIIFDIVQVGKFGIQSYLWSIDFSGSVSFSTE